MLSELLSSSTVPHIDVRLIKLVFRHCTAFQLNYAFAEFPFRSEVILLRLSPVRPVFSVSIHQPPAHSMRRFCLAKLELPASIQSECSDWSSKTNCCPFTYNQIDVRLYKDFWYWQKLIDKSRHEVRQFRRLHVHNFIFARTVIHRCIVLQWSSSSTIGNSNGLYLSDYRQFIIHISVSRNAHHHLSTEFCHVTAAEMNLARLDAAHLRYLYFCADLFKFADGFVAISLIFRQLNINSPVDTPANL